MEKNSTISRRDFIAKTALAGVSLVGAQFAWAASLNRNSTSHSRTKRLASISERRKLGSLEVSSVGLGCMNLAWGFGPPIDREDGIRLIREAYDLGVTFFDTAEVYGPFLSEEIVGEALAPVRDRVVIASKFGFDSSSTFRKDDLRSTMPRFTPEAMAANRPVIELLERVGRRKGARPGQVALAWLLARKPWIVPIPGTTKIGHLQENLGAADLVLTAVDVQEIETSFAALTIHGARSSEAVLSLIDIGAKAGTSSIGGHGVSPLPRQDRTDK